MDIDIPPPPRRAFGRAWKDFEPVTEPERKLAEAARLGKICELGLAAPQTRNAANTIRGEFLRFLALGGDARTPVHEKGVLLRGAVVEGELDLEGANLPFALILFNCNFVATITLVGAQGRTIALNQSRLNGLNADNLRLDGSLFLSNIIATGETRLLGARIAGNFDCNGATFDDAGGYALSCDGAEIGGAVFLSKGFQATGETKFVGARITGDLDCSEARFDHAHGDALSCSRAEIGGALYFQDEAIALGRISFAHAQVGTLADAAEFWPNTSLSLDGFRYHRISATAPLDAKTRIAWLDKQIPRLLTGQNFALQPWTHLAKVLREQGHFAEAAEVDIAREDRLRRAGRIAPLPSPQSWWAYLMTPVNLCAQRDPAFSTGAQAKLLPNLIPWALHWFYGAFAGYGYKPFRVIAVAFFAWLAFAAFYDYAASQAVFGPSNALVFQNKAYEHCRPGVTQNPVSGKAKIGNWTRCPELPGEYTSFSPLAYSADLILPVVSLGQSNDWAPITSGDAWSLGYVTRLAVWFEELLGWIATLTLAAIASGLVKRKDGD